MPPNSSITSPNWVVRLYLSPVLTAAAGSSHGYDVTDPTTVSARTGWAERFRTVGPRRTARGLGLVVDIVAQPRRGRPSANNPGGGTFCGTAGTRTTRPSSTSTSPPTRRGEIDAAGAPDAPRTCSDSPSTAMTWPSTGCGFRSRRARCQDDDARAVHDRQHYRLVDWRTGCAATGASSRSPRWPACARRIRRSSTRRMPRLPDGSPRGSSTEFGSIIPTG